MKLKLPAVRLFKKKLLIALGLLLVVLVAAYAAYSVLAWSDYKSSTDSWAKSASKELKEAVNQPVGEHLAPGDKRSSLFRAAKRIEGQSSDACVAPAGVGWQVRLEPVKEITDQCSSKVAWVRSEVKDLQDVVVFLEAEAKLAAILEATLKKASQAADPKSWPGTQKAWQEAVNDISEIEGGKGFEPVKAKSESSLKEIITLWGQLIKANKQQDQKAFESTRLKLSEAYEELSDVNKQSAEALGKLV